jgi:ubiquinone biosynthesis protein COQ4
MTIWEQGLESHLMKFIKNPADTSSTQEMYQIFANTPSFQAGAAIKLLANQDFKNLYEKWVLPGEMNLDEMAKMPENTLGSVYANHMKKNNLDPNFITEFKQRDLLSYLWMRAKHVHDIGHILTGFDTTLMGEISLKGFELAQYSSPSTAATTAAGLFSLVCLMPDKVEPVFCAFIKGYQLGQKFPLIMAIRWDQEWETPMHIVKEKYQLSI